MVYYAIFAWRRLLAALRRIGVTAFHRASPFLRASLPAARDHLATYVRLAWRTYHAAPVTYATPLSNLLLQDRCAFWFIRDIIVIAFEWLFCLQCWAAPIGVVSRSALSGALVYVCLGGINAQCSTPTRALFLHCPYYPLVGVFLQRLVQALPGSACPGGRIMPSWEGPPPRGASDCLYNQTLGAHTTTAPYLYYTTTTAPRTTCHYARARTTTHTHLHT